jgi:hypothetical protein
MKKSEVLEILRDQPEELDIDKLIYTLWFRRKLELAIAQADAEEGMAHEEFVQLSDEWLDRLGFVQRTVSSAKFTNISPRTSCLWRPRSAG